MTAGRALQSWRWGRTTAYAPYVQTNTSGNAGRALSVSLFDGLAEITCSKGSNLVGNRVGGCKNHRLYSQTNSSVGLGDDADLFSDYPRLSHRQR